MKKPGLIILTALLTAFLLHGKPVSSAFSPAAAPAEQATPEMVMQTGHAAKVTSLAFGPENKWIVSGSLDNSVKIWDVETGMELRTLRGHPGAVMAIAVNSAGSFLVSGGNDKFIRVWDVVSGIEKKAINTGENSVESLILSSDDKTAAVGCTSGKIALIDLESGTVTASFSGHKAAVKALAFSPDGRSIASGAADNSVISWDIASGKQIRQFYGHTALIRSLKFSPDGQLLAAGANDKNVIVWQVASGQKLSELSGHKDNIAAVKFSDANTLLSADSRGTIKTWNPVSKSVISSVPGFDEKRVKGESETAVFNSDSSLMAIDNGGGTIWVSRTSDNQKMAVLENRPNGFSGVSFSNDLNWIASAGTDDSVKLWNLETGRSVPSLRSGTGRIESVVFHPDNKRLISGSLNSSIIIWDAQSQKKLKTLTGHTDRVNSLAINGSGRYLVSGSSDQRVGIWDLQSETPGRFLNDNSGEIESVAISADESLIASASDGGSVKIRNMSGDTVIHSLNPNSGPIFATAFSPDGKRIAAGGKDKMVRVWDVQTESLLLTLSGHTDDVRAVSFSPDGKTIMSAGRDKSIKIWNASTGNELKTLTGHENVVYGLANAKEGPWLASASLDGSVRMWNRDSGKLMATLISVRSNDDWLVLTPDGYFDGSQAAWSQVAWRFDKNTFNVKPVEVFFNEFWVPGILSDILNDKRPAAASATLMAGKDRRQPVLNISLAQADLASASIKDRKVKVRINISEAPAGAKDVRLFRNGSLVKVWRGDALKNQAPLEEDVSIIAGENRLTAYCFNKDDIKSRDAKLTVTGDQALARKGNMYIFAIGINRYQNPNFDLTYAVNDAKAFSAEFKSQQEKLGNFEKVELIELTDTKALKANILNKLNELSTVIRPEDSLVVYYAGHGTAEKNKFYLIPHDLGYLGGREAKDKDWFQKILSNGISSDQIEDAVEKIDAGQFLLVVDACNSGQAIESQEKRFGPINSKGLAQLAYEKGIYILTAAQGFQAAKEAVRLGHGYLTYALIEDGIKEKNADRNKDGQVMLREWIDYAAQRVPQIDAEEVARGTRKIEKEKGKADERQTIQQPRIFYPRESDIRPFVVAR